MTSNSLGETIQRDMGVVGQDERISRLYASMQGDLVRLDAMRRSMKLIWRVPWPITTGKAATHGP